VEGLRHESQPVTKVFIGGSRRIIRLDAEVKRRIDRMIEKPLQVLVGDANGADKAVQEYLRSKSYDRERSRRRGIMLTRANVHDKWMVGRRSMPCPPSGTPQRRRCALRAGRVDPGICASTRATTTPDSEHEVRRRGIRPHIRRRGESPLLGCVRGRPRRWMVERTNSWHNVNVAEIGHRF